MDKESKIYKFFYGLFSFLFGIVSMFLSLIYILVALVIFSYGLEIAKIYSMPLNVKVGLSISIFAFGVLIQFFKDTFFKK